MSLTSIGESLLTIFSLVLFVSMLEEVLLVLVKMEDGATTRNAISGVEAWVLLLTNVFACLRA